MGKVTGGAVGGKLLRKAGFSVVKTVWQHCRNPIGATQLLFLPKLIAT
jgi:hypothetical protein